MRIVRFLLFKDLNYDVELKLREMIKMQMNNLLSKIEEEPSFSDTFNSKFEV